MWLGRFTDFIIARPWQTLVLVFAISLLPIVGVLGILIAAFITLAKDIREGAVLTIAATIPCVVNFYLPNQPSMMAVWMFVGFTILNNLFTWIFAIMWPRQMSFSVMVQIAALVGVLAVSVIHLAYPNVIDWWGEQLNVYYSNANTLSGNLLSASSPQTNEELSSLINHVKQYATGNVVMLILLSAISTVAIARWWQLKTLSPASARVDDTKVTATHLSLREELQNIRINQLTGFLFILGVVLAYLGNSVVIDIMPIVSVLFFASGLSLVHYLFGMMNSRYRLFWIIFFYALLIIGMPVSGFFILLLALFDIWLDFRNRFKPISGSR